jgi:hypothetical protein
MNRCYCLFMQRLWLYVMRYHAEAGDIRGTVRAGARYLLYANKITELLRRKYAAF